MEGFRNALEERQLCDMGYNGSQFTWSNRRQDDSFTKERLDWVVANPKWCACFNEDSMITLAARTSYHSPIQVCFDDHPKEKQSYHHRFKFEDSWTADGECMEIIKTSWDSDMLGGDPMLAV